MKFGRRDALQLGAVAGGAMLFSAALRTTKRLGTDVTGIPSAEDVRRDRASPMDDNPAADLDLMVFTDYRCGACRAAHPAMKRAVADDGKVRIIYKDWPIFGAVSERAARVAIASDRQNIYPTVHDQLMTVRDHDDAALRLAVEKAGGDWTRLQADLERDGERIAQLLALASRQAFALGLQGTPGYLIGPMLVRGALNEREFGRVFREARETMRKA